MEINPQFTEFEVNSSIRAIEVMGDEKMWFAGSNGMFGHTFNGGISWQMDSIQIGENTLEFRAIAKTEESLFLLNVAILDQSSVENSVKWLCALLSIHLRAMNDQMSGVKLQLKL